MTPAENKRVADAAAKWAHLTTSLRGIDGTENPKQVERITESFQTFVIGISTGAYKTGHISIPANSLWDKPLDTLRKQLGLDD